MNHRFTRSITALVAVAATAGLTACADSTKLPTDAPSLAVGDVAGTTPVYGKIAVCKESTSGTSGTFTVTRTAVGASTGTVIGTVTLAPGECQVVAEDAGGDGVGSDVTVTETSAGLQSVSATRLDNVGGVDVVSNAPFANGGTLFVNAFHGFTITFVNYIAPPPPPALQGCSPGYWKNHSTWPSPYIQSSTLFASAFDNAFPGKTMQQVLSTGGGGLTALGRQTVSALLNAQALGAANYGMSAAEVIAAFNAVYPGTNAQYQALQAKFESMTDVDGRICPLN